ncbi:MAG: ABC transporter permease [Chloroflexota bacterium]|nr:ABC transporter permease [Chloroflexota bacterium]
MTSQPTVTDPRVDARRSVGSSTPVWWLILRQELSQLWRGGRLLVLLVLFTVLMSITTILHEIESQVSLIPPPEMVFLTVLSTISFGMFISLIVAADSISGERERATLEPLLLTPVSRRQILFAKFVAALSPWPIALLLSIPYAAVLSRGDESLVPGLLWTALLGTLLAVAFTGFGLLVSIWSSSNRTSLFVSLFVYLFFVIPTQFPGQAQKGDLGYTLQQLNPLQASSEFIEKLIVNNRSPEERLAYLVAQPLSAVIVLGLLFLYAAPRLRVEGEIPRLVLPGRRVTRASAVAAGGILALLYAALPLQVRAMPGNPVQREVVALAQASQAQPGIHVFVDLIYAKVNTGDEIDFKTLVTNSGAEESPPLMMAMNIINLGKGDPVDPEDWSPERTQEVDPIGPGESAEQEWQVDAILKGNYMVYMTAVAVPEAGDATTQPVSSPGIHLTVQEFTRSNPGGVLPVALGIPAGLSVGTVVVRRYWRRERSTAGGSDER